MKIDKPVGLMLLGPSLGELDSAIVHFLNIDIYWVGMNYFWIGDNILKKINKRLDEAIVLPDDKDAIIRGIKFQREGGRFTLPQDITNLYPEMFKENNTRLTGLPSFYFILKWLKNRGANQIFLFGADGHAKNPEHTYYNQQEVPNIQSYYYHGINNDTPIINEVIKANNPFEGIEIYNCCLDSYYDSFQKINVYEAIEILTHPLSIYDTIPEKTNV